MNSSLRLSIPAFTVSRRRIFSAITSATLLSVATTFAANAPTSATLSSSAAPASTAAKVWSLDQTEKIGGLTPTVLGHPKVIHEGPAAALEFDGKQDGIILPVTAFGGLRAFTIELQIRPASDGAPEQRFFHTQDSAGSRTLLEIRLTPEKKWALDTFLFSNGKTGLPLLDRTLLHSADEWHWVALRYDGERMTSFVDGKEELTGLVEFPPMLTTGEASIGVRLNRVFWFKGAIREVRISPAALTAAQLSH